MPNTDFPGCNNMFLLVPGLPAPNICAQPKRMRILRHRLYLLCIPHVWPSVFFLLPFLLLPSHYLPASWRPFMCLSPHLWNDDCGAHLSLPLLCLLAILAAPFTSSSYSHFSSDGQMTIKRKVFFFLPLIFLARLPCLPASHAMLVACLPALYVNSVPHW